MAGHKRRNSEDAPAQQESRPRKVRFAKQAPVRSGPSSQRGSKRKREETDVTPDDIFVEETERQTKRQKPPTASIRKQEIRSALLFLSKMISPESQRVCHQASDADESRQEDTDTFFLSTAEAKQLLSSDVEIRVPIVVPGGAKEIFDSEVDTRRPIHQVFDFFNDPSEIHETDDSSRTPDESSSSRDVGIAELQERFLTQTGVPEFPWNFPDIPNPLPDSGMPDFVKTAGCTLLRDIMRIVLDINSDGLCPEGCPDKQATELRCNVHELRAEEFVTLQTGWSHWQSSMMLAEPGAITLPHWDKYSLGTWICCYEGEMGFAWLGHPSEAERTRWHSNNSKAKGRWLYVVLRAGDAIYLPPGTVHLVFRQPEGQQTLGTGGHLIRRADLNLWLEMLTLELKAAPSRLDQDIPYGLIMPGLLYGIKEMIEGSFQLETTECYGGREVLESAVASVRELERSVQTLIEIQRG